VNEPVAATAIVTPDPTAERAPHCPNCGVVAPGKFCPECGQETRLALPTVRQLMRDAAGRLVALDGRLWRTLFRLLFRPGMLTTEYFRGRRKRYVRPARLFFVMSLLMFAVIRLFESPISISAPVDSGTASSEAGKIAPSATPNAATTRDGARAASPSIQLDDEDEAALDEVTKRLPGELRKRVDRFKRFSTDEKIEHINSGVLRYGPYAVVALLPVFALLQYLAYLPGRRRHPHRPRRYAEHLVYGAHLHAFAFLMVIAMLLVPRGFAQVALGIWIVVYVARSRRNVYGGSWLVGFLRSFSVGIAYAVLLVLAMLALVAIAVALG
jgi:hypothetical protein